jgi:hypothetical protein
MIKMKKSIVLRGSLRVNEELPNIVQEIGKSQHKELGKTLRKKYVEELGFLPSSFDPELFAVRSTSYSRTIQSANNLLSEFVDNWSEGHLIFYLQFQKWKGTLRLNTLK